MVHLRDHGWRTLTLNEFLTGHTHGEWPPRSCLLTFDDGFRNFVDAGLPVLTEYKLSALVFVVPGWAGGRNDWPGQPCWVPRLKLMDWSEVRSIARAGMTIGAHSFSHAHMARLTAQELENEVAGCKHEIEDRTGCMVESFAYPYGEYSQRVGRVVRRQFKIAFGTRLGFVTLASRASALERIDAYYLRRPFFFRSLETESLRLYLELRRWMRTYRGH